MKRESAGNRIRLPHVIFRTFVTMPIETLKLTRMLHSMLSSSEEVGLSRTSSLPGRGPAVPCVREIEKTSAHDQISPMRPEKQSAETTNSTRNYIRLYTGMKVCRQFLPGLPSVGKGRVTERPRPQKPRCSNCSRPRETSIYSHLFRPTRAHGLPRSPPFRSLVDAEQCFHSARSSKDWIPRSWHQVDFPLGFLQSSMPVKRIRLSSDQGWQCKRLVLNQPSRSTFDVRSNQTYRSCP